MNKIGEKGNSKALALSQVAMLLVSTVAFAYVFGAQVGFVSAVPSQCGGTTGGDFVIPNTQKFCFGDSTYGYYIYTKIGSTILEDNRATPIYYQFLVGQDWIYSTDPTFPPALTKTLSTAGIGWFNTLANQVNIKGIPSSIQEAIPTSVANGESSSSSTTAGAATASGSSSSSSGSTGTSCTDLGGNWVPSRICAAGETLSPTDSPPNPQESTCCKINFIQCNTASGSNALPCPASNEYCLTSSLSGPSSGYCRLKPISNIGIPLNSQCTPPAQSLSANPSDNPCAQGICLQSLAGNTCQLGGESSGGCRTSSDCMSGYSCKELASGVTYCLSANSEQASSSGAGTVPIPTSYKGGSALGGGTTSPSASSSSGSASSSGSDVLKQAVAWAGASSSIIGLTGTKQNAVAAATQCYNVLDSLNSISPATLTSVQNCVKNLKGINSKSTSADISKQIGSIVASQYGNNPTDLKAAASALGLSTDATKTIISTCGGSGGTADEISKCVQQAAKIGPGKTTQDYVDAAKKFLPSGASAAAPGIKQSTIGSILGLGTGPGALFFGHLIQGFVVGAAIWGGLSLVGKAAGLSGKAWWDPIPLSAGVGWAAGETAYGALGAAGVTGVGLGVATAGIGLAAAGLTYFLTYQKHSTKTLVFTCVPWQAGVGGGSTAKKNDCSQCGGYGIPCTQYQCQSLGQGCKLLNKGTNSTACVYSTPDDTTPPVISFMGDVLTNQYTYAPKTAVSPPGTGVYITYTGDKTGAVPAYTPLQLGIKTNEPSRCRMDVLNKGNYSNMTFLMNSGLFEENHTFSLSIPSLNATTSQTPIITNGGIMNVFVRCKDANNNTDVASFVIQFKVQQGEDTTPPMIMQTDPLNDSAVFSGVENASVSVYVNEPVSGCKWSHTDKSYEQMSSSNAMDCSNAKSLTDMNPQGYFKCIANLTGIQDRQLNVFYFRCNDSAGNVNDAVPAYTYYLLGTQPLAITSITPNDTTIKGSTTSIKVPIKVTTSGGESKGQATCYYNSSQDTGSNGNYTMFDTTNSYQSTTTRWLPGNSTGIKYDYNIRCVDNAGNAAYENISFTVQNDSIPPKVTRIYKEGSNLIINTNENSTCVFDTVDCTYNFDPSNGGGIAMTDVSGTTHSTPWVAGRTYYIKCKDNYNNQPPVNTCTVIVAPSSV